LEFDGPSALSVDSESECGNETSRLSVLCVCVRRS
jgi:hypothetical protein